MTTKPFDFTRLEESVSIAPHNPNWAAWFEAEVALIRPVFGNLAADFQHVGSSVVVGLLSKPIVDILVGVKEFIIPVEVSNGLARLDYEYFGQLHANQERAFARKRGERSFNLQIVPFDGKEWAEKICFRDYLQAHPDAVDRYSEAKRYALEQSDNDLLSYHKHKDQTVVEILQEALTWNASKGEK